jgi:flagellar biosynthesis protein FlhG
VNDQAARLRRIMDNGSAPDAAVATAPAPRRPAAPARPPVRIARAIAIASGKGGVGKSNLAVNMAVVLSRLGLRVCLLDADLGLANADVLCDLTPRLTLEHVLAGRCRLADAMVAAPGGFRLIPGASGVARLADLRRAERDALIAQLAALERAADVILIDTGAGIGSNVLSFAAAAHTVVVVLTPEPTALTDGYGLVKSLVRSEPAARINVVVNMARGREEGPAVHERLDRVARTFLRRSLGYAGVVPHDGAVGDAVRQRTPFVLAAPASPAAAGVRRVARRLIGAETPETAAGGPGFLARLAAWLRVPETAPGGQEFAGSR